MERGRQLSDRFFGVEIAELQRVLDAPRQNVTKHPTTKPYKNCNFVLISLAGSRPHACAVITATLHGCVTKL
jgi:hypothetical protein